MRTKTWLIATLLACSGFCALVYQVAWLREFRLIYGASTLASAAVLAIFIGGLGLGGLLLGPRADPWAQSRYVYRALDVAMLLATRDTQLAGRMFAALGLPFAVDAAEDARLVTRAQVSRQLDLRGLCVAAVGALEPHVPWNEPFLRLRRDCYEATNHPLLQTAVSDLDEFLKTAPRPVVSAP